MTNPILPANSSHGPFSVCPLDLYGSDRYTFTNKRPIEAVTSIDVAARVSVLDNVGAS